MIRIQPVLKSICLAAAIVLLPVSVFATTNDQLRNRIDSLNAQIDQDQATLNQLTAEVNTLRNKLASIDAQIAELEHKIDLANLQIKDTRQQIAEAVAELEKKKAIMFENARTLYKIGSPSTIEILASSDNFSEFIDRQEYLQTVREAVNEAAADIVALKDKLVAKQQELEDYVRDQEVQRHLVAQKRAEQAQLLTETAGQESKYQQLVKANKQAAEAAQAELNRRLIGNGNGEFGTGSYPYSDSCGNPYPAPWDPAVDACPAHMGGYIDRQCVSYAYWRRGNVGKAVPGFWGNAGDWPANAAAAGYRVDYTPAKYAIGVIPGFFGHVFIVEEVLGPDRVLASQYNYSGANKDQWGKYSIVEFDTSGLQFIH